MNLDGYRRLRTEARRFARKAEDIDDLVQDSLLAALEAGRGDVVADDAAWFAGVIRNQAALGARSAIRRRRREAAAIERHVVEAHAADGNVDTLQEERPSPAALLARLPPAARRVAVLALHGLNGEEIRWILELSPTAFRQRLTSIRKALGTLPPAQRAEALALAYVRDPARSVDLQFGLIRRALKTALRGRDGIGTHDADGHLIVLRGRAHTSPPRGNE
jgi:DNA-directed RNA polymerase specialized sigma24 family protein